MPPAWTNRASSANNEEVVETSREISAAVWRNERSSASAGLVLAALVGVCVAVLVDGVIWEGPVEETPPWMDFMAPVAGTERAIAKNSSVLSAMV